MGFARLKLSVALTAVLLTCGCTKRIYVPVDRYVMARDSLRRVEVRYDSVCERDSIVVTQRGDTVNREVWRWRYRDRMARDTLWRERRDTVVVERTVPAPQGKESNHSLLRTLRTDVKNVLWGAVIALIAIMFMHRRKD